MSFFPLVKFSCIEAGVQKESGLGGYVWREKARVKIYLPPSLYTAEFCFVLFFPYRAHGARGKAKSGKGRGKSRGSSNSKCCLFSPCPDHVVPENHGCDLSIMPSCQHAIIYFRAFEGVNYFSFCPSTTIGDSD